MMEIPVLLQSVNGNGYRASVGEPFKLSADGGTRDEALGALRALLEDRAKLGDEIVTLRLSLPARQLLSAPLWPNDDLTSNWLNGLAEYRKQRDAEPDSWEAETEPEK